MSWWSFKPYVSVAQRRAKAQRELKAMAKKGHQVAPVQIAGREIAKTFWGRAWCDNLEGYSDFENRLPRGRTYVRNGSVVDLQIEGGRVSALVSGSSLYRVKIELAPLSKATWKAVKTQCAGQIGSLVDLLQGKLSQDVMAVVTARDNGLFPKPKEIRMSCSCPDYAYLCKHLAAVLYGIGARFDQRPELLFQLRGVDHLELIEAAGERAIAPKAKRGKKTIAAEAVADVFGIELSAPASAAKTPSTASPSPAKKPRRAKAAASRPKRAAKKRAARKRKPKTK